MSRRAASRDGTRQEHEQQEDGIPPVIVLPKPGARPVNSRAGP